MKTVVQIFTVMGGLTLLIGQGCGKSDSPFNLENILGKNNGGIYGGLRGLSFSASEVYTGFRPHLPSGTVGYNFYYWKGNTSCPRVNPTGPAPERWISGHIHRTSTGTNYSPSLCSDETPITPPSLFKRLAFDTEMGVYQDKVYFLNNSTSLNSLDIRVAHAYCTALYPTAGPRNQGFSIVIYSKKLSGIAPYFARIREGRLENGVLRRKTVDEFPVALSSVGNFSYVSGMEDVSDYSAGLNSANNSQGDLPVPSGDVATDSGSGEPTDRDPGVPSINRPGVPQNAINMEIKKDVSTATLKATIDGTDFVLDLKCTGRK